MTNKKLKDLCSSFSKESRPQSPLDSVATEIFKPESSEVEYLHSSKVPEKRYDIPVHPTYTRHHNDLVEDFENFGPNEKYLINKVLFSPSPLLFIVGGIGVGKTTFVGFLRKDIIPKLKHSKEQDSSKCPFDIYMDFRGIGSQPFSDKSFEECKTIFSKMLCDEIEAMLGARSLFSLEDEVGDIWEGLISSLKDQQNFAIKNIMARLREEAAESRHLKEGSNYERVISKRKAIRKELIQDESRRSAYLAALIGYINDSLYKSHPGCLIIIVDNIDLELPTVQQAVKMVLKPFANLSKVRIVVTARQTTFRQVYDDNYSVPIDYAAYCGPSPMDVIRARLACFSKENLKKFYQPENLTLLIKGIQEIENKFLKNDKVVVPFIENLCGHSIRKGLIIAQNLIDNSIYDPYEIGKLGISKLGLNRGDVIRAIMAGCDDAFTYNRNGIIENIFQVQAQPTKSYLIKLRILKALFFRHEEGRFLKEIIDTLLGFQFSLELIRNALNEMMFKEKRLIWSDAVKEFKSESDLMDHLSGGSKLFISSAGKGYISCLAKDLNYIQEIMLDTCVRVEDFGQGWNYSEMGDRLELVFKFCSLLQLK